MRRIDKRLNIQRANLLTEQRYMEAKTGIIEGPTTDIAGVTDELVRYYDGVISGSQDIEKVNFTIWDLVKKTLKGHGADADTQKNLYLTLANKLDSLSQTVDPQIGSKIASQAQFYRSQANQVSGMGQVQEEDGYISPDGGEGEEILDWAVEGENIVFKTTRGSGSVNVDALEQYLGYSLSKNDVVAELYEIIKNGELENNPALGTYQSGDSY